jgi:hypothetical protein
MVPSGTSRPKPGSADPRIAGASKPSITFPFHIRKIQSRQGLLQRLIDHLKGVFLAVEGDFSEAEAVGAGLKPAPNGYEKAVLSHVPTMIP